MDGIVSRGQVAFGITLLAVVYSLGLLGWVVAVPAFDGQTLLEYGGPLSVAITAQSLLVSLVMWTILHRRCTASSNAPTVAAWALGSLFLAYSVVGAVTIAAGALPAALILLLAVAVTPRASYTEA